MIVSNSGIHRVILSFVKGPAAQEFGALRNQQAWPATLS